MIPSARDRGRADSCAPISRANLLQCVRRRASLSLARSVESATETLYPGDAEEEVKDKASETKTVGFALAKNVVYKLRRRRRES